MNGKGSKLKNVSFVMSAVVNLTIKSLLLMKVKFSAKCRMMPYSAVHKLLKSVLKTFLNHMVYTTLMEKPLFVILFHLVGLSQI